MFSFFFSETNYHMARYHFIRSDDMKSFGSMLVEVQVELGFRSEIDLFITQAVLQLLCIRNSTVASSLFDSYIEDHPLLSNGPPYKYPLLNFTWLLLLAIQRYFRDLPNNWSSGTNHILFSTKQSSYSVLCKHYQPSLKRDPTNKEYLDRIGQVKLTEDKIYD